MGLLPSVSAYWRISEESFVRDTEALDFINNLKVRASYGVLGDDSGVNYDWTMGYNYPAGNPADNGNYNGYSPGYVFNGQYISAASPMALPNVAISWYKSKTFDVGVDFDMRNGLFGFSFDYFHRKRTGLYERNNGALPTVVGATGSTRKHQ